VLTSNRLYLRLNDTVILNFLFFCPKLHNPGPGTWLDKATAALAVGKPLAGAQHGESK
jgi:hypothetical protein